MFLMVAEPSSGNEMLTPVTRLSTFIIFITRGFPLENGIKIIEFSLFLFKELRILFYFIYEISYVDPA